MSFAPSDESPGALSGFHNNHPTVPWTARIARNRAQNGGSGGQCGSVARQQTGFTSIPRSISINHDDSRSALSFKSRGVSSARDRVHAVSSAQDRVHAVSSAQDRVHASRSILDSFGNGSSGQFSGANLELGGELGLSRESVLEDLAMRRMNGETQRSASRGILAEIFAISDLSLRERRALNEREPGGGQRLLSGEIVNSVVGDVNVPVSVGENGEFFGDGALLLSTERFAQLNGFGPDTVTSYIYNPSGPGSRGDPFVEDYFLIDLGPARQHQWRDRIYQSAVNVVEETQKMCIWINGMQGRTIRLTRREAPYYFTFRNQKFNPLFPGDKCDFDADDAGFYFTQDNIGGGEFNIINGFNPSTMTPGAKPRNFPGTCTLYADSVTYEVRVDNSWPSYLFYQCTLGPMMGGLILVFGDCE
jgi:hypothetical protein